MPIEFLNCIPAVYKTNRFRVKPEDIAETSPNITIGECPEFGMTAHQYPRFTIANCTVFSGVDCAGERTVFIKDVPCIKYTGYYFSTTVLLSVLLGLFGADRLYAGYCLLGSIKLVTLGGVGIWWIVDLILLVVGVFIPENGSSWEELF